MPREEQYAARIPPPHLQTIDMGLLPSVINKKRSLIERSLRADQDQYSIALSGMLVKKNQKMMTMNQYDLVPEVIYNSMEI